MRFKNWKEHEIEILKQYYEDRGVYYCHKELNEKRSISSIRKKASRLDLTNNYNNIKNKYSKEVFKKVIGKSKCLTDVIKHYGLRNAGGNYQTIKKYIKKYNLDTSHFDVEGIREKNIKKLHRNNKISLGEILIKNSTYNNNTHLKNRLYDEGLKKRKCEMCGQGEEWNGKTMSLILDHINGINDDNELKNLRIVCPNCNATLPTHAGKNSRKEVLDKIGEKECKCCGKLHNNEEFCSQQCYLNY